MLCLFQIDEQGAGRCNSQREIIYSKSLEGIYLELTFEFLDRIVIDEGPFFECGNIIMVPIAFPDALFVTSRHEKLLRSKRTEKGADIIQGAFGDLECSCRDIQKCCTASVLVEGKSCNVIMFLLVKKLVIEGNTRSHEFSHSPLDDILGKLGIFELVADSDLITCTY